MKNVAGLGRRVGVLGLGGCILGAAIAVAACSSDAAEVSPTAADGSTASPTPTPTPTPAADGSTAPADAGEELITEGGGLIPEDPDAGVDEDGGIDAGPACGTVTPGAYSTTTCSSLKTTVGGGALTTTSYQLDSVTVLGSPTFCASTFAPFTHRGGLKVTASSPSAATFEFFDVYRKVGGLQLVTSARYDAQVVATGTKLAFTPGTCATKAPPAAGSYTVAAENGKKVLVLHLPYGSGYALYRFVEP